MNTLFISHSGQENEKAIRVRDWLRSEGWGDVFLDLDPRQGIAAGQRWQEELKRAGENCAAVVVLISPSWAKSVWCRTEFLVADQLGKKIFPVLIEQTPVDDLPFELRAKYQFANLSAQSSWEEGLQSLAVGLRRAGLDPKSFEWPPKGDPTRSVYRGLQSLEAQDAAIFFGRDAAITRGLDELRRISDGAPQRLLIILGASGAGKSSYLAAGLIARLKRDPERFLVLPTVRPGRAAITGVHGLVSCMTEAMGKPWTTNHDLAVSFAEIRNAAAAELHRNTDADIAARPLTILLPIDQAEELFSAENSERLAFCAAVEEAIQIDQHVIVVAAIRTDSYEPLQKGLMPEKQSVLTLPPIAPGSFERIIEGPAALADPPIRVEPALTQQLLTDLQQGDALPLLAFTLQRLQGLDAQTHHLTLDSYQRRLGGIGGAIQAAVAEVLGAEPSKEELALARRLFVPALVQVDNEGVKRRVARRDQLAKDVHVLADRFVEQRLLTSHEGNIEVAHEALLRQWPTVAAWIAEERDALQTLNSVRAAASEWVAHGGLESVRSAASHKWIPDSGHTSHSWLAHRDDRLKVAVNVASRVDFASLVEPEVYLYLEACDELAQRRKRASVRAGIVGLFVALAAFAGGLAAFGSSSLQRRDAAADALAAEWQDPETAAANAVAMRAELAAAASLGLEHDISQWEDRVRYAELSLQTYDEDRSGAQYVGPDSEPEPGEDRQTLVTWLNQARSQLESLRRRRELGVTELSDATDEAIAVALFYARVYELARSNAVSRSRLAVRLGQASRFWAGLDRQGASFVVLDSIGGNSTAMAWLRERAILGARIVANDYERGAPPAWLQLVGVNESFWEYSERMERQRGLSAPN